MKIAITGFPGSGKTTLTKKMFKPSEVVHTDDFIDIVSFKDTPEVIIRALMTRTGNYTVEGVQVARMLRTGHREGSWCPDVVIWIDGGDPTNRISKTVKKAFDDWHRESGKTFYTIRRKK